MEHVVQTKSSANVVQKKQSFFAPAFVQPKFSIGPADDVYEREADATADKVMRMSDGQQLQAKPSAVSVQRKCSHCEEEEKQLQKKPNKSIIQRDTPANNESEPGDNGRPYLHLSITVPAPGKDDEDKINYGEANIQLIDRGINTPADYTVDYSNLWKADYELSKGLRIGTMIKNLYGMGERFDAKALRPVRGVVKRIPLVGGLLKNAIKFEAPKIEGNDWDKYAADKMALSALGNSLNRDNPAYNDVSGHTFTINVIDTHFDENNITKLFRKPASSANDSMLQRKCSSCEAEEKISRKESGATAATPTHHVEQTLQSNGQSMDHATRSFMEERFGYDFSKVQIHNDAVANRSSADIDALAYTHGNHIVFANGKYRPDNNAGKQLLAHELTHVIQQGGGVCRKVIQREEAVSEHSTHGINYASPYKIDSFSDNSTYAHLTANNYWYQKINSIYTLGYQSNTALFGQLDTNNINIFLAKAWELRPAITPSAANPTTITQAVILPAKVGAGTQSKSYLFYCLLSYSYSAKATKPQLDMIIVDAVAQTTAPINVGTKIAGIKKVPEEIDKTLDRATGFNFPAKDVAAYFKVHPEVRDSIGKYAKWRSEEFKKSSPKSGQEIQEVISVSEINSGKAGNIMLMIDLSLNSDAGVDFITLNYSQEKNNKITTGYDQKDVIDFLIEKYNQDNPGASDKIGTIDGLDAIFDTNERMIVKNVAFNLYTSEFQKNGAKQKNYRDTEVDQIIPISSDPSDASKTEFFYYTFIVHKADVNNLVNISVKRIGKKGDVLVGEPTTAFITRVPGYAENAFDADNKETPGKLLKWILNIYKGVAEKDIKAATVADITTNINAVIQSKSGTADWFKKNYSINVLDAVKGEARLKSVLKVPDVERIGVKDYSIDELKLLELALEKFGKILLDKLRGIYFIRQAKNLSNDFGWVSGLTTQPYIYTKSTKVISAVNKTITIYDTAFNNQSSFIGGSEGINPGDVGTVTHEMGHAEGGPRVGIKTTSQTYQDAFNKFFKGMSLIPVTKYSKDTSEKTHSPETEYFPEAFMLFMDDPEWLLNNQYQTYFWFLFFQQKGTNPSDNQIKSLISVWEKQKAVVGSDTSVTTANEICFLWIEYFQQKKNVPDGDSIETMVSIASEFKTEKNRVIRMDEAGGFVAKWLAFVKKNKRQPLTEEIKSFFP